MVEMSNQAHPKFKNWPTKRKMAEAVRLVLDDGWTQSDAARHVGVSRSRVNVNVGKARKAMSEGQERSKAAVKERVEALAKREDPLPPPIDLVCQTCSGRGSVESDTWDLDDPDNHLGWVPCPSCQSAPETPDGGGPEGETSGGQEDPPEVQPPITEVRRVPPAPEFMKMYFGNVVCPDCGVHHEIPEFHNEIISELTNPSTRRLLVNVAPYHAKSTVGTVYSTIHTLCANPNSRTAIISKTDRLAQRFVAQIQRFLTDPNLYDGGPNLIEDWGPFYSQDQWAKNEFWIAGRQSAEKDPSVSSYGVGTQIYGYRFDRMLFDDIADIENQRNPDRVAEMLRWATLEAASRVGKTGLLAFIGTRIGPQDIYSFLKQLPAFKVITYPCIQDEAEKKMLWGDHYPYEAAAEQRESMSLEMFNLVYQNTDVAGTGATFPLDVLEASKDLGISLGMYQPGWRMVLGVDPAGAGEQAGYTAMVVLGIDLDSGRHFVVDLVNVKQMRAPQIKDQIIEFCLKYPISEVRVEVNGLQSQLFQYDQELINNLTQRGVRFVPHITSKSNKWDPQFGIESMGPMFYNKQISAPYADINSRRKINELLEQLSQFPVGSENPDLVMALWFAYLGTREIQKRLLLPAFDGRFKAPARIKRKRVVADFGQGQVRAPTADEIADPYQRVTEHRLVNVAGGVEVYS